MILKWIYAQCLGRNAPERYGLTTVKVLFTGQGNVEFWKSICLQWYLFDVNFLGDTLSLIRGENILSVDCKCFIKTCPIGYYMYKVDNRNIRRRCEIWLKVPIKTPQRRHNAVFIVNFEYISHLF